jgi:ribosomal-protein-alanine N-acetyltransferase
MIAPALQPARMRPLVRPMDMADLPQVQAIDALSFPNPWPQNAYRFELLENPNGHCWVVQLADQVVGVIVCWLVIDEIHIATIAVHPNWRRRGIGKALVIAALQGLIPLGGRSATLEVRAGNEAAQKLYRYFGFVEVGRRKRYYKDNDEDAILMTVFDLGMGYRLWLAAGAETLWHGGSPAEFQQDHHPQDRDQRPGSGQSF